MRKTLISLIFIVIVFVITTIGVSLSLINSDNYLKNFRLNLQNLIDKIIKTVYYKQLSDTLFAQK